MSDIFDHELDAYESMDRDDYEEARYARDPLYYHRKIKFDTILKETDKAILIRYSPNINITLDVWVPLAITRQLDRADRECYVHRKTFAQILKNNAPPQEAYRRSSGQPRL